MQQQRVARVVSSWWRAWGREFVIVLGIMVPFRSSIADWNHVPTGSMKPTILECERVFVNKLAYDLKVPLTTWHLAEWADPARGDVVIFRSPTDGTRLVKRVVGVPGDVVQLVDNRLLLNGEPAAYTPVEAAALTGLPAADRTAGRFAHEQLGGLDHLVMALPDRPARRSFGPVRIPADRYLMLGDNRDNSGDSRFFGLVARDAIVGKVPLVVASFDPDRGYLPRVSRWFTRL